MSDWTPLANGSGETAAERAAREERHQVIIELLAAYGDGELPPETTSQIDAHLVGCERCRRDLAMHQAVRRRLGVEPPVAAPPALRERVAAAISTTPVPPRPSEVATGRGRRFHVLSTGAVALVVVSLAF